MPSSSIDQRKDCDHGGADSYVLTQPSRCLQDGSYKCGAKNYTHIPCCGCCRSRASAGAITARGPAAIRFVGNRTSQDRPSGCSGRRLVVAFGGTALASIVAGTDPSTAAKVETIVFVFHAERECRGHEVATKLFKLTHRADGGHCGIRFGSRRRRSTRDLIAGRLISHSVRGVGAGAIGVARDTALIIAAGSTRCIRAATAQYKYGRHRGCAPDSALHVIRLLSDSKINRRVAITLKDTAGSFIGAGEHGNRGFFRAYVKGLERRTNHGIVVVNPCGSDDVCGC
jgi:hypothetical protein